LWWIFWDRVSRIICLGLALNWDSPDLYLLSSRITGTRHSCPTVFF
jgi:hypothetical protein